ncbi:MAG: RNA polymerase sigma factor [Planctomycetota bacterium]|jgi:RNA polymerase sigma-70 factor (ECF subfamily)
MAQDVLKCDLQATSDIVDEDQILVSAARRDPEAVGRLFDKYYGKVLGYIYHCTLDHAITEDLTSNVFLAAFEHLGRFRWRQVPFRAWLFRIATNEVRMHWRRQKRVKTVSLQPDDEEQIAGPSAGDTIASAEEYRLLHRALLELRLQKRRHSQIPAAPRSGPVTGYPNALGCVT